jgi:hypothetical protein
MNAKGMLKIVVVMVAVGASLSGSAAFGQLGERKTADARVGPLLDRIGWKYEVDGDGDYRLGFAMEGENNGQLVFINSRTAPLGALEVREVWSPAFGSASPFPAELLNDLLEENHRVILGAWRVVKTPQGYLAVFGAHIAADSDAAVLGTVVQTVSLAANLKARRFSGASPTQAPAPQAAPATGRLCRE